MITLYKSFKKTAVLNNKTDFVKIYKCSFCAEEYTVIIPKRFATKNSVIHCIDDYIAWEQIPAIPRLAGKWDGEKTPIYKFGEKTSNTVFVVKGHPNGFVGLDEGIFHSANNFDKKALNVMSLRRFKKLEV